LSKSCFLTSGLHKVPVALIDESIDRDFIRNKYTAYTKNDAIEYTKNTTLNPEAVRDVIPVLFELLRSEEDAGVRAIPGHFIFVYIHPYMDGNGRIGRFLFNTMLASGGYSWTVVPVEQRDAYMAALERASVDVDIQDFARFLGALVEKARNITILFHVCNEIGLFCIRIL